MKLASPSGLAFSARAPMKAKPTPKKAAQVAVALYNKGVAKEGISKVAAKQYKRAKSKARS